MIAAIGLLGAALAPALQAVDTEMSWESAAFAAIVLVAVGVVAVPRAWHELLVSASLVVGVQVEWLAAEPSPVPTGSVAVAGAFVLTLLGIAVARQLVSKQVVVDPLALSYAVASFGLCLALATQVLDERGDRGIALLVAATVWALLFAGLHRVRQPDLAAVVATSALALGAVGTADLLSGSSLTLAWAAQAVVLAALARRLGDARLQAMGAGYVALAAAHALATDARPTFLFDAAADHRAGVLLRASCGVARLAGTRRRARGERGHRRRGRCARRLLPHRGRSHRRARAARLRRRLPRARSGRLHPGAGGLALYGASLGILEIAEQVSSASVETDFERGHTAVSGLWALVGLGLLVVGLLRGSALVRYAGLAVFGLSLAKIFLYDLASLSSVARAFSFILVGGLLLAGGFFVQRLSDRIGPRPGASPQ